MNQQHPIFVYGTLLPHEHNHTLFGRHIAKIEPAIFRGGSLLDCGAYPVLLEGTLSEVWGVAVTIKLSAYKTVLAQLDRLEGYNPQRPSAGFYRRELRSVWLGEDPPPPIQAHIYIGNPHFIRHRSLPLVPNGRWLPYARMKRERALFPLGRVTCTPSIVQMEIDLPPLLGRHQRGDWGAVSLADWHANEMALCNGERILSVYEVDDGKIWVITEADRSFTTLLLPEEYQMLTLDILAQQLKQAFSDHLHLDFTHHPRSVRSFCLYETGTKRGLYFYFERIWIKRPLIMFIYTHHTPSL